MAIAGLVDTDVLDQFIDQRPRKFREGLLRNYPNGQAPLLALTAAMPGKDSVDDPEFAWFEQEYAENRLQLAAPVAPGDTTLQVVDGALKMFTNQLYLFEMTGEVVRIAADPNTQTQLTVERGYAGTVPSAVDITIDNPFIFLIGNSFGEGSRSPRGSGNRGIKRRNYTQIFRTAMEVTRTARVTRLRTGDIVQELKKDITEDHSQSIERALFWGKPNEILTGPTPSRTTQGIIDFIETNSPGTVFDVGDAGFNLGGSSGGGSLNMEALEEILYEIFRYGSNQKMCFCGGRAHLAVQRIVRRNHEMQFHTSEKMYGMDVNKLVTGNGEMMIKTHPQFNVSRSGELPGGQPYYGYDSWMVVMDMANVRYVTLKNSETRWEDNLEENDEDGMKAGWLTECGTEFHFPRTHGIIKGLVTGESD